MGAGGLHNQDASVLVVIKRALAQRPRGAAEVLSPFEVPLRVTKLSLVDLLAADTRICSDDT